MHRGEPNLVIIARQISMYPLIRGHAVITFLPQTSIKDEGGRGLSRLRTAWLISERDLEVGDCQLKAHG